MEGKGPLLPYYMVYSLPEENAERRNDREYFRQLYPQEVKRYIRVIVEVLDRIDLKESYIYDEYPDRLRMERLADIILRMVPLEKNISRDTQKNLIRVLLWEEIIERRERNRRSSE